MARASLIRVPIGRTEVAVYHSSTESVLANIRGVKVAYPSNGADLKGLLKAAYEDPNPVGAEHKGLYRSDSVQNRLRLSNPTVRTVSPSKGPW